MYIGKDSYINKKNRYRQHCAQSHYDSQPFNRILQNNLNRYTYQVLVWDVDTEERLNALEIQYIRQLKPKFNFTLGGDGTVGFQHSEKTKQKIGQANKGWKMSQKEKKKISQLHKGKKLSDEHKQKISKSLKGIVPWNKGKTDIFSQETLKKLSEQHKGENHHMWGKHHPIKSRKKISKTKSLKMNKTGFYRVRKAKSNSKKGFIWMYRYYDENNKRKSLSSVDLKILKQRVLSNNLEWKILNEDYARQSLQEDMI